MARGEQRYMPASAHLQEHAVWLKQRWELPVKVVAVLEELVSVATIEDVPLLGSVRFQLVCGGQQPQGEGISSPISMMV
jgi:hypothetical protein